MTSPEQYPGHPERSKAEEITEDPIVQSVGGEAEDGKQVLIGAPINPLAVFKQTGEEEVQKLERSREILLDQLSQRPLNTETAVKIIADTLPELAIQLEKTREVQNLFLKARSADQLTLQQNQLENYRNGLETLIERFWQILPIEDFRRLDRQTGEDITARIPQSAEAFRRLLTEYIQNIDAITTQKLRTIKPEDIKKLHAEQAILQTTKKLIENRLTDIDNALDEKMKKELAHRELNDSAERHFPNSHEYELSIIKKAVSSAAEMLKEFPPKKIYQLELQDISKILSDFRRNFHEIDGNLHGARIRLERVAGDALPGIIEEAAHRHKARAGEQFDERKMQNLADHLIRTLDEITHQNSKVPDTTLRILAQEMVILEEGVGKLRRYANTLSAIHQELIARDTKNPS